MKDSGSTCQHCDQPVVYGMTEGGFRGFVHTVNGLSACPEQVSEDAQ